MNELLYNKPRKSKPDSIDGEIREKSDDNIKFKKRNLRSF